MSENTGGPAFPGSYTGNNGMPVWSEGMTLRDYFAAQALQGVVAALGTDQFAMRPFEAAETAYLFADCMLAARR